MRRLPSEDVLGTLGKHTFEAHGSHLSADVVAIDERRVTEHLWLLAEVVFHLLALFLHVGSERLLVGERRQAVAVRLGEELYATRVVEFLEFCDDLWRVHLELFHSHARDRESHLKQSVIFGNHLADGVESRHVRLLSYLCDASFVLIVVVVVVVDAYVEETVSLEMYDLMYLKI